MASAAKPCLGAVLVWPLSGVAWSAQPPPPSAATTIVPTGAISPTTLGNVASGARFLAPRSYLGLWKPFAGGYGSDSSGSVFPTNRTAYMTVEIPDDVTAAQLIFANQAATPYTITDAAISGSSQYGASSTFTPGVQPYDGAGNALTSLFRVTFANGGANSAAFPPSYGSNCLTTNASSAANQAVLNFAATAGVLANQVVVIQAGANYLTPQTYVTSTTSTTVTLAQSINQTVPSGTSVCFLPVAATIPAATLAPIQTLTRSDWVPLTSYPRLDSPVATGGLALATGIPANDAVTASTPTSVTLAAPTTAAIPAQTKINFCRATTVTNAAAPVNTLSFASVPSTVVAGMYASFVGSANYQLSQTEGFPSSITVTGTTPTSVALSTPFGQTVGSGQNMLFSTPLTVTSTVTSGSTITVNSAPSNVATGMSVIGTNIAGANGTGFTPTTTISGISGTTLTLSAAVTGTIPAGATIYAVVILPTNAATTVNSFNVGSTSGIYPGALVTGAGIAANTYAVNPGGNFLTLSQGPTATLTAGQTLNFCDPLVTTAAAPAGSATLSFAATTYPNRLFHMRINFGSSYGGYWLPGGSSSQTLALGAGALGNARMDAGLCGAGNDGVLNPTSISNTTGTCGRQAFFPVWAVKFQTARRGIVIVPLGDSHFEGDTTFTNNSNMTNVAGVLLSTPNLPVWTPNLTYGGQNSNVFLNDAWAMIQEINPSIVTIAGYTWNDIYTTTGYANYLNEIYAISKYVQGYGGLPVILAEYPRQVFGCDTSNGANEAFRLQARTSEMQFAASNNLPLLDVSTILTDPNHGGFINPAYSTDCIHANDNGHGAAGAALANLLQPYLAN